MKALFSVPEGQKVTEKQLHRVLLTSICSILLCMSCLAGSTWAWFAASVENTDNVIEIAKPGVILKVDEATYEGTDLSGTGCTVQIEHGNEIDVFEKKSTLYVVVTVRSGEKDIQRYTILSEENAYSSEITILNEPLDAFTISAVAYWSLEEVPTDVQQIEDNTIRITSGEGADEDEEPTEPPAIEPNEPGATEPAEPTNPSEPETSNPDDNEGNNEGEGAGDGTGNNGAANGDDTTGSNNGGNTDPNGDNAANGEGGENPGSGDPMEDQTGSETPSDPGNSGNTETGGDDTTDPDDSGNTEKGDGVTTETNPEDPTNPTPGEETGET